jgi:hypothetical protein
MRDEGDQIRAAVIAARRRMRTATPPTLKPAEPTEVDKADPADGETPPEGTPDE